MSSGENETYMKLLTLNLLALTALLLKHMEEEEERYSRFKVKGTPEKRTPEEVKQEQREKAAEKVNTRREKT
jgi:hypothetical protein